MESKAEQFLESKGWMRSNPITGGALFLGIAEAMEEFCEEQNATLIEKNKKLREVLLLAYNKGKFYHEDSVIIFQTLKEMENGE